MPQGLLHLKKAARFNLLYSVFKIPEWAETVLFPGQGVWEALAAARLLAAGQAHCLSSGQDQQHPAGARGSNPNQAAPRHLQEGPDCLRLVPKRQQLLLSSCWHSECSHFLLPRSGKIGLNSHWKGWYSMPPYSVSVCMWITLTGKCDTVLIQWVNLTSHYTDAN